jgi:two-component system NarL family response regulator
MNKTSEIKLLIVDDHILLREGLVSLFNTQPGFEVVGEAGTVADAISLSRKLEPSLILMDFGLPDGTGLEATQAILADNPDTNIIFLTVHEAEDDLFAAIRSGAKGYLLKNIPVAKMINAIKGMMRGEAPISREMTSQILAEFARNRRPEAEMVQTDQIFTPRELDVLAQVVTGASNKEIADNLFVSVNTVKNHIHNMLCKLDLKNRRELAKYAEQHGLT